MPRADCRSHAPETDGPFLHLSRESFVRHGALSAVLYLIYAAGSHWTSRISTEAQATGYAILALALAWAYLAGVRRARSLRGVTLSAALFSSILVFAAPIGSNDIFGYILRGRTLSVHGLNPYTTPPDQITGDPFQPFTPLKGLASPYGPLWTLMAAALTAHGSDSPELCFVAFKLVLALFHLANGWLVHRLLDAARRLPIRGAALYLWNPLVLVEGVGNGHNDLVMVTFVLGALHAYLKGARWAAGPLLALGAAVKIVPCLLAPVLAFDHVLRRGWRALAGIAVQALLGLVVLAGSYLPFYQGSETFEGIRRQTQFHHRSLAYLVLFGLHDLGGLDLSRSRLASQIVLGVLFTAVYVAILVRLARTRQLAAACLRVILYFLLFFLAYFQPWYVTWGVPLAALPGPARERVAVLALSMTALLSQAVFWLVGPVHGLLEHAVLFAVVGPVPIAVLIFWGKGGPREVA